MTGTALYLRGLEAEVYRGLEALYERHAPDAVGLAYLLTGDRALAEDLVQEAFARIVGRFAHLRDPVAFPAYLRHTVINLANSHFRRRRLERSYARQEEIGASTNPAAANEVDVREDLWRALQGLPERQRAAIVLRFYEDVSEADACAILLCRPGTYRSLVSRGLTALRKLLQGVTPDG